jgi:hypothetical protein
MNNLLRKISTILDACVYRPSVIEDGGARVPYYQYVAGVELERKELVKAIKVLQDQHEKHVDESLDLRGENKVIGEESAGLRVDCRASADKLRFLKHECMVAKRRLSALRDANDRQVREQEGVREQIDAEKQKIWLCQQDSMRKKIQKKSIALQVEAHKAAEKQGLVPQVAVDRMKDNVKEQEQANVEEKARFETTLTHTFGLLEDIRKVQNERKVVMVAVDELGARHEEFERCHTPRPSIRVKKGGRGAMVAGVVGGFNLDDADEDEGRDEGSAKMSTVEKVDELCGRIKAMRVETRADELQEKRQQITRLRAELQSTLSSLKKAMLARDRAGRVGARKVGAAPAASSLLGEAEDGTKYFIGKGSGADVPRYLRTDPHSAERIPFRPIKLHELRRTVRDIWQQKRQYVLSNPRDSAGMIFREFVYLYLQHKYGIHKVIVRWGYTLTYAILNFRWDEEIDLFYQILAGHLPPEVYEQQEELTRQLHSFLRRMNRMLISAGGAEATEQAGDPKDVLITRGDCLFCLSNFFPSKDSRCMKELTAALDVAIALRDDHGDGNSGVQQAAAAGGDAVIDLDMLLMTVGVWEGDKERGTFSKADGHKMASGDRGGGQERDRYGRDERAGGGEGADHKSKAEEEWKAGDRSDFQRVLRTQHQREVTTLLAEVEDRLTVVAAPGLYVTISALHDICKRISSDVTAGGLCTAIAGLTLKVAADAPHQPDSTSIDESSFDERAGLLTVEINEFLHHTKLHGFVDGLLSNCHYKQEYRDPEVAAAAAQQ